MRYLVGSCAGGQPGFDADALTQHSPAARGHAFNLVDCHLFRVVDA